MALTLIGNTHPLPLNSYHLALLFSTLSLGLALPIQAAQITGLESPNSFVGDPSGKEYFISNINGEPGERDNNGFITKLNAEGKVTKLKFIQGGVAEVLLHAPKGMTLVGPVLYGIVSVPLPRTGIFDRRGSIAHRFSLRI